MTTTEQPDPDDDAMVDAYVARYFPTGLPAEDGTPPPAQPIDYHGGARQSVTSDEHEADTMAGFMRQHFPDGAA